MLKRILIVIAIIFVVAGLALANTSTVTQDGTGNEATVTQAGTDNEATVNQYGTNLAEIEQVGSTNTAQIDQGASGSPVTNFHKPAYATDWLVKSRIEQNGTGNNAHTNVHGASESASATGISQQGDENSATQDITGYSSYTNNPTLAIQINQVGNLNEAEQSTAPSFGCYSIKDMLIQQNGEGNVADQESIGGMECTMEVIQVGNDNSSTQYQWARFSTAHVDICGNNNTTTQYQKYGVWSTSGVHQAYIDIIGDDNTAIQSQTGESHYADINVNGCNNYASQTQTGTDQSSVINQTGDFNTSNVTQGP